MLLIFTIIIQRIYTFRLQIIFGIIINLFFLITGIYIFQAYNRKPNFYEDGYFTATLLDLPQEKTNSYEAVAKINTFTRNDTAFHTHEQIIIYFSKENDLNNLQPGNILLFKTNPQRIKNFGNPYEFDYRKYLERKKIYRQVYLNEKSWIKTKYTRNSLPLLAERTRQKLLNIYKELPIDNRELEILSALTLGYKRDLDPETKHVFSSAGAMHVLAVSGLHVGIIFWIIVLLLGYLRKHKNGRIIFTTVAIFLLWCYAFITGLSPSVTRATTMFSIFILGETLHRKSNVYNSLAASAFFLLLINPNNLFETGFQLSYSAVFGIAYLQPKISSPIKVKNKILLFFRDLLTVSIAAQITTTPFTLYYFGQFPSYFWLTNLIIIPAIMVLIPLGIFLLVISGVPVLSGITSLIINAMIKFIFHLLSYIEQLPFSVLHITISETQQIILIAIALTFFILIKYKRTFYLHLTLVETLILIFTIIFQNISNLNKNELIIYNNTENATLELIHNKLSFVISEKDLMADDRIQSAIKQTAQKRHLMSPQFFTVNDTVVNQFLFLKNGIVYFEGKTVIFGGNQNNDEKYIHPDIIINPVKTAGIKPNYTNEEIVITNKRFILNGDINKIPSHNTTFETAFRKIW